MKINIVIIATFMITNLFATEYRINLDNKHYKNSIVITPYVPEEPETPILPVTDISSFLLSNGTTEIANYTTTTKTVQVTNGILPEGYSYLEFTGTIYTMAGVSSVNNIGYSDGTRQTSIYGSNGAVYGFGTNTGKTYTTGNRLSILVKQPEGKMWFAKDGFWALSGNPQAGTGFVADYADNTTLFPHLGSGSSGGASSQLILNSEDWLHYDNLMSWLEN